MRFKKMNISKDVQFDKDSAYIKSKKRPNAELEETEVSKIWDTTMNEATAKEYWEMEEPQEPVYPLEKKNP